MTMCGTEWKKKKTKKNTKTELRNWKIAGYEKESKKLSVGMTIIFTISSYAVRSHRTNLNTNTNYLPD